MLVCCRTSTLSWRGSRGCWTTLWCRRTCRGPPRRFSATRSSLCSSGRCVTSTRYADRKLYLLTYWRSQLHDYASIYDEGCGASQVLNIAIKLLLEGCFLRPCRSSLLVVALTSLEVIYYTGSFETLPLLFVCFTPSLTLTLVIPTNQCSRFNKRQPSDSPPHISQLWETTESEPSLYLVPIVAEKVCHSIA